MVPFSNAPLIGPLALCLEGETHAEPARSSGREGGAARVLSSLVWVFGLCQLVACVENGEVVEVHVDNLMGPVTGLQVSALLNGVAASRVAEVQRGFSDFRVALPEKSSGRLVLDVVAQYNDPCWTALGQGALDLSGASARSLLVVMDPLQADGCHLQVQLPGFGDGRVFSTDSTVIDCPPRCDAHVAAGTQLTLRAQVAPRSAWGGWSGACAGQPGVTCSLTVDQDTDVSAAIRHTALLAVWGTGEVAWIAGPAGLLAWRDPKSKRWTKVNSGVSGNLRGLGGFSANDLWAVGEEGTIVRLKKGERTLVASGTTNHLDGIWCGTVECWAVGQAGTLLHWQGDAWLQEPDIPALALHAVWGSRDGAVWAAGDDGLLLRRGIDGWRREESGTTLPLYGLGGWAANNVWAVGAAGTVLRWNGTMWSAAGPLNPGINLRGVWVGGSSAAVLVGDGGIVFEATGVQFKASKIGSEDLLGIWDRWAVGSRGGIYEGPLWILIG